MNLDWIPLVWGLHHPWRLLVSTVCMVPSLLVGRMVYEEDRNSPYLVEMLTHGFGATLSTFFFTYSAPQNFSVAREFLSMIGAAIYIYHVMTPKKMFDWMLWK